MRLLHKSNPTLFEWNSSPIIYQTTEAWREISKVIDGYFVKKAGLYHYLSTARSNYREYLHGETVRLKKYFYVMRPILACRWILKYGTPPPMLFDELAAVCLNPALKPAVDGLLKLKRETPELGEGPRIGIINDYLNESIEEIGSLIAEMPDEAAGDWDRLNKIFLTVLKCANGE